jgi:outer membrane lipoprotein-sorting protein
MKYNIVLLLILTVVVGISSFVWQNPISVLEKIDANMSSVNRVVESEMTIYGKRTTRVITSKTWSEGRKSYTEYLSPASDRGTKMLKLDNQLWIYSPATDRVIQISGNMLRQSVMGSDLSYEDMMDSRTLHEMYSEQIIASEQINERDVIVYYTFCKIL